MIGIVLITVLTIFLLVAYYLATKNYDYWKKRNIPYIKPVPLLGNYGQYILQKKYLGKMSQSICQQFPKAPYIGAYYGTEPTLLVQDPELIKRILVKDFHYFGGRENSKYSNTEPLLQNLFTSSGNTWKVLRQNQTPLFSGFKIKQMFKHIRQCIHKFEDILDNEINKADNIEIRPLVCRYTVSCAGSCALGIDTEVGDETRNVLTDFGKFLFGDSSISGCKLVLRAIWPGVYYGLGFKKFTYKYQNFVMSILNSVFESREYKPSNRNDFADLLLNIKKCQAPLDKNKHDKETTTVNVEIDDALLAAQCISFFGSCFEATSIILHYVLYELAKNAKAQERAIEEIDEYLKQNNNNIEYDCLTKLPYIEACTEETMRLYPVIGIIRREVLEDYKLPCGAVLNKGVRIHIPIYHMHHDPDNFPDPETFMPERFFGDAKRDIKPFTYIPFGDGLRQCIGIRLAKMEMYSAFITILKKYRLGLSKDTPKTVEFLATTLLTRPAREIKLQFILREDWQQRVFNNSII